jgi:hypothetical protein
MEHVSDASTILEGSSITKTKRTELFGQCDKGAGTSSPENYQRQTISSITKIPCLKTNIRINLRTNTLKEICYPNKHPNGFDYSENFDGVQTIDSKVIYINLKCVVGSGGSQTRSLREVYWFIQGQLNVLLSSSNHNLFFANILDGDEAYSMFDKYNYLLSLPEYSFIKHKVYVGDLKNYFKWFETIQS